MEAKYTFEVFLSSVQRKIYSRMYYQFNDAPSSENFRRNLRMFRV
jgi:hypothetical protein